MSHTRFPGGLEVAACGAAPPDLGRAGCPSCTTRRALETGAHLESVLPRVDHRQWTLSLPFTLRFLVVKKPKLLKRLDVRLVKAVWRWQRREAKRLGAVGKLRGGAVCFWQWFGSSPQLTPHLHLLVPEALWREDGRVLELPPPADDVVAQVLHRVLKQAKKDWADLDAAWAEDEYEVLQQRAIQERLGLAGWRRKSGCPGNRSTGCCAGWGCRLGRTSLHPQPWRSNLEPSLNASAWCGRSPKAGWPRCTGRTRRSPEASPGPSR